MIKNPYSGLKNIPHNIWILAIATLINRAGTMVLPFLALYATQELNVNPGSSGLVLTFYGIGAFITAPFAGRISDKIGPLKLMKISLISTGLFLFVLSLIKTFESFLALTLVWAIISESFRPASMSFISEQIEPKRRKTAFALNRLAINLGMSIGPMVGGFLSAINFSLLFYVDGVTSIAAAIFLIVSSWQPIKEIIPENPPAEISQSQSISILRNKKFLLFLLSIIPAQIVFFQHIGALPIFIVENLGYSTAVFGLLTALNTVIIIFIEVPLNDSMRLWPAWKALALGAFITGIGFGLPALNSMMGVLIFSVVIWTFGEMIFFPSSGEFVAEISPPKKRGEYMGYFQMTFSFSLMVGPWIGTEVLETYGAQAVWAGCLVFGLITSLLMLRMKK